MNEANGVFYVGCGFMPADSLRVKHVRTRRSVDRLLRHSCSRGGFLFFMFMSGLLLRLMTGSVMFALNTLIFNLVWRSNTQLCRFQNIFCEATGACALSQVRAKLNK